MLSVILPLLLSSVEYKYWGCQTVPRVPKVRRIDSVEQIRRGWGVKMNMIKNATLKKKGKKAKKE